MNARTFVTLLLIACSPLSAFEMTCNEAITYISGYECKDQNLVGEGSTGKAFKVVKEGTIKPIRILKVQETLTVGDQNKAIKERDILKLITHKNVIGYFDSFPLDSEIVQWRINQGSRKILNSHRPSHKYYFVVMEEGKEGSLGSLLKNRLTMNTYRNEKSPNKVLSFFMKLLKGVEAIHAQGFVHTDLKTDNIVLDGIENPKIIDFDITVEAGTTATIRGTPYYLDPLMADGRTHYKYLSHVDVHTLGILLFAMMHPGDFPFKGLSMSSLMASIRYGRYKIDNVVDFDIAYLIYKCLRNDIADRYTIPELIDYVDFAMNNHNKKKWSGAILYTAHDSPNSDFVKAEKEYLRSKQEIDLQSSGQQHHQGILPGIHQHFINQYNQDNTLVATKGQARASSLQRGYFSPQIGSNKVTNLQNNFGKDQMIGKVVFPPVKNPVSPELQNNDGMIQKKKYADQMAAKKNGYDQQTRFKPQSGVQGMGNVYNQQNENNGNLFAKKSPPLFNAGMNHDELMEFIRKNNEALKNPNIKVADVYQRNLIKAQRMRVLGQMEEGVMIDAFGNQVLVDSERERNVKEHSPLLFAGLILIISLMVVAPLFVCWSRKTKGSEKRKEEQERAIEREQSGTQITNGSNREQNHDANSITVASGLAQ